MQRYRILPNSHYIRGMKINFLSIQHGAAVGGLQAVLSLVMYVVQTDMLFSTWASLSSWILLFAGLYLGIKAVRTDEGGFISYGRALGHGMLVALTMTAVVIGFSIVLYTVIDPGLVDMAVRATHDQMAKVMEMMGQSADDLAELTATLEPEIRKSLTPGGLIQGGLVSVLLYLFPTAIMALVLRRREPVNFV